MHMRTIGPTLGIVLAGALTLSTAGALAQAAAERRLDAALDRLRAALGPTAELTIDRREIDPVTGRARLTGVSLIEGPRLIRIEQVTLMDLTDIRIGRAELRGVVAQEGSQPRIEAGRLLFAGLPLPAPGQPFEPEGLRFGQVEADNLTFTTPGEGVFSVGRLALEGYAPGVLRGGRAEGLRFVGDGADGMRMALGRVSITAMALPDFSGAPDPMAFGVQHLALDGLAMAMPAEATEISLGRLVLRDALPGGLLDLALDDARVVAPLGSMGAAETRLKRLEVAGVDAFGIVQAVLLGADPPETLPNTPQRIFAESLTVQLGGRHLAAIGRFATTGTLDEAGLATGGVALEGLSVALPAGTVPALEAMGYPDILGSLAADASLRVEGGVLTIESFAIGWEDAAALTLAAQMTDMPSTAAGMPKDPSDQLAQVLAGRLAGLTLTLEDRGLLTRAAAWQAEAQRLAPAALREQWAEMAMAIPLPGEAPARPNPGQRPGQRPAPQAAPQATDPFPPMRQAIAAFIREGGALTIALRPPQPLVFGEMAGLPGLPPAQTVQRLGLSITRP
jgi:hypothetical protein